MNPQIYGTSPFAPANFEAFSTGKSFSEALILTSIDKRLFIDLPVQYMKTTSSEHVVFIHCSECQNKNKEIIYVHTTQHVLRL